MTTINTSIVMRLWRVVSLPGCRRRESIIHTYQECPKNQASVRIIVKFNGAQRTQHNLFLRCTSARTIPKRCRNTVPSVLNNACKLNNFEFGSLDQPQIQKGVIPVEAIYMKQPNQSLHSPLESAQL